MQERNQKDSYKEQIKVLVNHLNGVAAIVVGAASGMSAAAGFRHYYERDQDFIEIGRASCRERVSKSV